MIPEPGASTSVTSSLTAPRNQRYTYLVARLRNRQMTMEEATELYTIMDGMLRASEAGRLAAMRTMPSPMVPPEKPMTPPPSAPAAAASSAGDDFFLLGILAMGAGAGLLAAMTKRMQDLVPSAPPRPSSSGSKSP